MPVYKRKSSKSWLIKFDFGGKTIYASHRGSKADAKTKEAKIRSELEANNGERRAAVPTFESFVD